MASTPSFSLSSPPFTFLPQSLPSRKFTFFVRFPGAPPGNFRRVFRCNSGKSPPPTASEQDILRFVAESDGKSLPCVRTYENGLARLSLVGTVGFDQALVAAAADGGKAAAEHIRDGVPVMVVETVFPEGSDPNATISTRLFLPTNKVKERARKLRKSFSQDVLAGNLSDNILAMTFRQVVMRKLWNFQLMLFKPGTERDMEDLQNTREVSTSFTLSASNEQFISVIAEVICICALQNTERHFLKDYLGRDPFSFLSWFRKHKRIASRDSSVVLVKLFDDELVENAKNLLEYFNSTNGSFEPTETRSTHLWWNLSVSSELEKIGGPLFSAWTREHVPAYRLEIDASRLADMKFEGWRKTSGDRWEVLLTHSQMVGLAETLDMYFEDIYSLPNKRLPVGPAGNYANLSNKKRSLSLLKILSTTVASGILLVAISAMSSFCFKKREGKELGESLKVQTSEVKSLSNQIVSENVDSFCVLVVNKLKSAYSWPGDITTETGVGAWIGTVPDCVNAASGTTSPEKSDQDSTEKSEQDTKSSVQDVASYQVVLSSEGKVIGFQPTSRVGVNHWAANPLSKELYGGRKLSPGLIEPGLKSNLPGEVVVLELLMSENSDSPFALARPLKIL